MNIITAKPRICLHYFWDTYGESIMATYHPGQRGRKSDRISRFDRKYRPLVRAAYDLISLRHEHGHPVEAFGKARIVRQETIINGYKRYILDVNGFRIDLTWFGWDVKVGSYAIVYGDKHTLSYDLKWASK